MESYSGKNGEEEEIGDKCFLHCQSPTSPPPALNSTSIPNESSTLTNDSSGEEFCDQDRCTEEETKLLAHARPHATDESSRIGGSILRESSSSQFANSPITNSVSHDAPEPLRHHPRTASFDPLHKKDQSHSYQFRRKLANFRSDSVFSDVTPHTCQESQNSSSDSAAKSGSLSSLKPRESKWTSLRKKLGKLNSSTTKRSLEQQKPSNPGKSVEDKRSLLQRAKTLSILPVRSSSKDKEDQPKKPVKERKSRCIDEMFNVGGEMNMIPLELLIDVNDLNVKK